MIDVKLLREKPEEVKKAIATKNADPALVDNFVKLDTEWRAVTASLDTLRAEQNKLSAERNVEAAKANKVKIKEAEEKAAALEKERNSAWEKIPNLPSEDTPIGKGEEDNTVIHTVGVPPQFDFEPKDHLALGEALGLIDMETAGAVSGPRFAYIKGALVRIEFALVQYALEILTNPNIIRSIARGVKPGHSDAAFVPVVPPVMIKPEVFQRMARLEPKEERYHIPSDDLYLVGSAEHTLGPLHMDQIIPEEKLPLRYVGFSTSFRREAGSYGKDTRGILRVHQFDKVEMESFTTAENAQTEQDFFVAVQEYLMWTLEIPYRIVMCCTADQGDPDARHLDLEAWMPGQKCYRETHSADLMNDYQARRLNTRVKRKDGRVEFAYMNDATVFAIGRTLIAIMENYQTADGKIGVPKALQKYVGAPLIG
ncbi:MAG TPA: serine--tRNA ligase [Candidatus Paceibacterota bacterium]|nr:serine--tRNA ligase [Candidatus Paceibacterota bacterium]